MLELFCTESIFVEDLAKDYHYDYLMWGQQNRVYVFTVIAGYIPTTDDTENLLNDCVVLNTYSDYFTNYTGFECIQIACGMESYDKHLEMSLHCKRDIIDKSVQFKDSLMIDELVKNNTSAKKQLKDISPQNGFYPYDFTFTKLKKDLGKLI